MAHPAVYKVWHQTAGIQKRNFPRSSLAHVYAHVVRASGHMPDRTTADRDHTLGILPHSGTGQRDRYTGTLGRSRLATPLLGLLVRPPKMSRRRTHVRRLTCKHAYAYAHIHAYAHVTPRQRTRAHAHADQVATRAGGSWRRERQRRRSHNGMAGLSRISVHAPGTLGLPQHQPSRPRYTANARRVRR